MGSEMCIRDRDTGVESMFSSPLDIFLLVEGVGVVVELPADRFLLGLLIPGVIFFPDLVVLSLVVPGVSPICSGILA